MMGGSRGKRGSRGNMRRMDFGSLFECSTNGGREIGGWVRERNFLFLISSSISGRETGRDLGMGGMQYTQHTPTPEDSLRTFF